MAKLRDKVQTALDENRILVLGSQVLLGMQWRAMFEDRFDQLSPRMQALSLVALVLMILGLALLLMPATVHRVMENGEDSPRFLHFVGMAMRPALLPFVAVIALDLVIAGSPVVGGRVATAAALALCALSLGYLWRLERRGERPPEEKPDMDETAGPTPLGTKIRHVLTEARVVLPGAQALLGFQFATMLTKTFAELPASSRYVHLASFFCVAVATMLLMAPAAHHRLVEHGEETPEFHRYASRMVLAALVPLGLGVVSDLYVVARKISGSMAFALVLSGLMLVVVFGLWFGFSLAQRWLLHRRESAPSGPVRA